MQRLRWQIKGAASAKGESKMGQGGKHVKGEKRKDDEGGIKGTLVKKGNKKGLGETKGAMSTKGLNKMYQVMKNM